METTPTNVPSAFDHIDVAADGSIEPEPTPSGFELIAESDGKVKSFEGADISVNRDSIDPGNMTLSGKEHAQFTFKDGKWHIKDLSSNHATFVQVTGDMPLEDGMILVLGQRIFRFNTKD